MRYDWMCKNLVNIKFASVILRFLTFFSFFFFCWSYLFKCKANALTDWNCFSNQCYRNAWLVNVISLRAFISAQYLGHELFGINLIFGNNFSWFMKTSKLYDCIESGDVNEFWANCSSGYNRRPSVYLLIVT